MKILLIGAGYVGMALLASFSQEERHEVVATTTTKEKIPLLEQLSHKVILLEEHDTTALHHALQGCDAVILLVAPNKYHTYEETYLETAQKVMENLKDNPGKPYLLYSSSTSVYEGLSGEVDESLVLSPVSPNGKVLVETENLLLEYPKSCILRLGGIFGPGRELIQRAKRLSGQSMPGTGDEPTNSIHQQDIVKAIHFCLEQRLTGVFNLVNNEHPSRKELYSGLCESLGLPPPLWNHAEESKGAYKVSNRKIVTAGFTPFEGLA